MLLHAGLVQKGLQGPREAQASISLSEVFYMERELPIHFIFALT